MFEKCIAVLDLRLGGVNLGVSGYMCPSACVHVFLCGAGGRGRDS